MTLFRKQVFTDVTNLRMFRRDNPELPRWALTPMTSLHKEKRQRLEWHSHKECQGLPEQPDKEWVVHQNRQGECSPWHLGFRYQIRKWINLQCSIPRFMVICYSSPRNLRNGPSCSLAPERLCSLCPWCPILLLPLDCHSDHTAASSLASLPSA